MAMATSQTPVIPIKQAMVEIAGYQILAICTEDGSIYLKTKGA
jgi:hypothetical protein